MKTWPQIQTPLTPVRLDPKKISDGAKNPNAIDEKHLGPVHFARFQNVMRQKKMIQDIELAILNKSRDLLYEQWDREDAESAALAELNKQRDALFKKWQEEDAAGENDGKS